MTPQQAIKILAFSGMELYCKVCIVDSIDEAARTVDCTPIDDSAPIEGVNLQANQGGEDGVVLIPALDSYVVVGFLNNEAGVVLLTDKVDKILVKIGEMTIEMSADGVVWNRGTKGLTKVDSVTEKLNALESDINSLKAAFQAWMPVAQDGGAALKISVTDWASSALSVTAENELADTKIKH